MNLSFPVTLGSQSKLLLIEPQDWEIDIFLQTEQFRKVSKDTVWKESRKKI